MQNIFETYIKALLSAVHYNAYYISSSILDPEDNADIFSMADTPLGIYLKNLKEKLQNHYNEDLAKKIYNNCFCSNRKSSFSIHMTVGRKIAKTNAFSSLDIYIDTDKVARFLETDLKKPNSITLKNSTEGIYNPSVSQNIFYSRFYRSDVSFHWKCQPEFNVIDVTQNNLIPQRNTHTSWSWVLGALLLISAWVSAYNGMIALLAISLLLLLFITYLACNNTTRIGNYSMHRFFHSTNSQPSSEVESSELYEEVGNHQHTFSHSEPESIDILQFFNAHFSSNRIEEVDSNNELINTTPQLV